MHSEEVLNHAIGKKASGVARVYHLYDCYDEKAVALEKWGNLIEQAVAAFRRGDVEAIRAMDPARRTKRTRRRQRPTLEFGPNARAKGPRAITVSMNGADGSAEIIHDCALVRDGDRHVIVPPAATFHFAIGPDGLDRRHGRPANLAAQRIRAMRDLVAAAKRADPNSPCLEVHTGEIAA